MRPDVIAAPAGVNKYLLAEEQMIICIRRHPAVLFTPAAEGFSALAVALILNGALVHDLSQRLIVWIPAGFLIAQALLAIADWFARYFVVTSVRILFVGGLARTTVAETSLAGLGDLTLGRSASGRLFGHGTLYYDGAGRTRVLSRHVAYPEQLYREICALLHPSANTDTEL